MMKITGLSHLFKWENLHNWWLTKYIYFFFFFFFFLLKKNANISRHNTSINLLKTKLKTIKQIRIVNGHIPINVTYSTVSIQINI